MLWLESDVFGCQDKKLIMIDNLHGQPDWICNHLGDIKDVSLRKFKKEVQLWKKEPCYSSEGQTELKGKNEKASWVPSLSLSTSWIQSQG